MLADAANLVDERWEESSDSASMIVGGVPARRQLGRIASTTLASLRALELVVADGWAALAVDDDTERRWL